MANLETRKRNKIYLADDSRMVRELAIGFLVNGFPEYENRIIEFGDGLSLYNGLQTDNYEVKLVLTDDYMPKMNGLKVIEELAKVCQDIPFILMTGMHSEKTMRRVLDLGGKGVLFKPFKSKELTSALRKYL